MLNQFSRTQLLYGEECPLFLLWEQEIKSMQPCLKWQTYMIHPSAHLRK